MRGVCGGADERTVVADAMCSRAAVGVPHGVPLGKRLARTEIACRNQPMRIALDRAAPRGSRGCSRRVDQTAPGDVALNKTEFENAFDHSSLAAGACEGELDAISFSEALGQQLRRVRCRGAQAVEAVIRRGRLVSITSYWSRSATRVHRSPLRAARHDLVVREQQSRAQGDAQPASEAGAPRAACHASNLVASK